MKKLFFVIIAIFISVNLYAEGGEFEGEFLGVNENDEYVFKLNSGEKILMQDIDYDIDIDLFNKELVGKKFKVTWELSADEEADEEADEAADDESLYIRKIVALEQL